MKKSTILIVDDDATILASTSKVLSSDYQVRVANSGERALQIAATDPVPSLILLDLMMPGIDGYEVLSQLKRDHATEDIPIIFVTGLSDNSDEEKGLALGAADYITKPINPAILLARVKTQLTVKQASDFLRDKNLYLEAEVQRRMEENETIQSASIHALARLAEVRDPETGAHILRTQGYIEQLARLLINHPRFTDTLNPSYIKLLVRSAPLHDIGKVGIPDQILLKPGEFSEKERRIMDTHAAIGAEAISKAEEDVEHELEFFALAKEIAHWHHEKWDGSGYPDQLSGEQIPISARLMAIADVFDALISKRVYKKAFSYETALGIIVQGRGKHFDPDITDAFSEHFSEFVSIAEKYRDSTEA